jgi:prepilin-type N-terminal cleavage/methylation domain-containing protein
MKRNQSGFTLIEIAIVLVIIGLLLGGVLKGQELINSAKVKNLATDFKNVPVYIYGYQDKYKALPGDDSSVVAHVGGILATTGGTAGNGIIDGVWNSPTQTDESYLFWQHVRLAGFGPGSTTPGAPDYLPKNTVGGAIGVTNSLVNNPITLPAPLKGTYVVCSDGIPGKFAKQLDNTLDDGNTATGSVMVTTAGTATGGTAVATTAIVDDQTYLVCMGY